MDDATCSRGVLCLFACTACVHGGTGAGDLHAVVAPAMPTVVHVIWTSDAPTIGHVEVSDGVPPPPGETQPTVDHDIRVLGLHAETAYDLMAFEDDGSGPATVGTTRADTGALDPAILPFTVVTPIAADGPAYFLTSAMSFNGHGYSSNVWVVDREGIPVWGTTVQDLFPAFPVWDPEIGVRTLDSDFVDYGNSRLDTWTLDGDLTSVAVPGGHHESLWLDDGTVVYTRTDSREVNGTLLGGDQLIERAPDGSETTVWDAFEDYPTTHNRGWEVTKLADGAADWTHANGIEYIEADDDYLISLYYPASVVRVDRALGTTEWILGGADGEFLQSPDATFGPQHSPCLTPDGILLFDNGNASIGSRLEEIALDVDMRTASLAWQWAPDPLAWNLLLGHVEQFGGGLVATWGMAPEIYMYDSVRAPAGHLTLSTDEFDGALGAVRGLETLY